MRPNCTPTGTRTPTPGTPDENADAILALMADALLSDEAIDGMLERRYGWVDYEQGTTYKDLPEREKADARGDGRHEIMGALDAAGIGGKA